MLEATKNDFLRQFPQYSDDRRYNISVRETTRYNGDFEVNVFELLSERDCIEYNRCQEHIGSWWCKLWNNEQETTYVFEREKEVHHMRVSVDLSDRVDFSTYYNYPYNHTKDYDTITKEVLEQYKKDNEQKIRETIASKILSGEIKLDIYESDTDCWDAPLNQIEKIYYIKD